MIDPLHEPDDLEAWKAAVSGGGIPGKLFDKASDVMHGPVDESGIISGSAYRPMESTLIDISVDTFRNWLSGVEPFDITGEV